MSIILYANGLTEEFRPKENTFLDEELLGIFPDFDKIRSFRLLEIPNVWCLWGENNPIDKLKDEFSKLGSDILEQSCYSPILFIHDTEINYNWNLIDITIFFGYNDFRMEMLKFFENIASDILNERERIFEDSGKKLKQIILEQTGVSKDKRIIFKFDIEKQIHEFFMEENLMEFAKKVHDFLKSDYRNGDIFVIYADKNIIIVLDDDHVESFIKKIIDFFESKENYEVCSVLRNTYKKWVKYKKENTKLIRSNKNKSSNENKNIPPELNNNSKKDE